MKRHVKFGAIEFDVEPYKFGRTEKVYDAYLKSGFWPEDKILVNLCEGGATHKGGSVADGDNCNHKIVTVLI
ncbi:MAG: hypothetical protein ACRDHZ_00185 [Ktedonobacteraceae bacterium]